MKASHLVLALCVGAASFTVFAEGHGRHGKGACGEGHRAVWKQLDLTADQQAQLKTLREQNKADMQAHHQAHQAERQAHHQQMQQLVLADSFDENAVRELATSQVNAQVEKRVAHAKRQHEMLSILTPEQKAKWQEARQERMNNCQGKRHHR
ncbi:hypothetical protein VST7929_02522 [Vibrio stylophorae]|uniref:CpxP family protein n=1 Tax=Vibrio stylophorae TaxID=659351 RepID=A0ABN8DVF8_9VIBR|nr:CpxP family protein [Vibrio stylophorae]CAH0534578.1 hypothetical protein VST7929_02522 [Vibrio stylophorae]